MVFEIYKRMGKFRWRLKADNGEIIASGQGYSRKQACEEAVELVKSSRGADVHDLTVKPSSGGGPGPKSGGGPGPK